MIVSDATSTLPTTLSETGAEEKMTVADAVWVGTALLHRMNPEHNGGFRTDDIVTKVRLEGLTEGAQRSIYQHVNQHCVANRKPMPNRQRMLFALGGGLRRLYRPGDPYDPARSGSPTHPVWETLPKRFSDLRQWYTAWSGTSQEVADEDPLLALVGSGKHIWADEHADEYVSRLREGWE